MARTRKIQIPATKTIVVRPPAAARAAPATSEPIRATTPKRARTRSPGVPAPTHGIVEASVRAPQRVRTTAPVIPAELLPAREPAPAPTTKTARLIALLQSEPGASITDIVTAFGWLPHSARAALTGLRKRGHAIVRSSSDGTTRYRIADGEKA